VGGLSIDDVEVVRVTGSIAVNSDAWHCMKTMQVPVTVAGGDLRSRVHCPATLDHYLMPLFAGFSSSGIDRKSRWGQLFQPF
jgi:hypothetical protein